MSNVLLYSSARLGIFGTEEVGVVLIWLVKQSSSIRNKVRNIPWIWTLARLLVKMQSYAPAFLCMCVCIRQWFCRRGAGGRQHNPNTASRTPSGGNRGARQQKRWPRPARHASRARARGRRAGFCEGEIAVPKKIGMDRVAGCVCRWKTVNWWWIETAGFLACGRKPDATPRAAARMWIVERRWVWSAQFFFFFFL